MGDGPVQATRGWINWPGLIVEMCSNRFSGEGYRIRLSISSSFQNMDIYGYLKIFDLVVCNCTHGLGISMNQQLHPPRSKCSVHAAVGEACKTCLEYDIRSGIDLSTSGAPGSSPT